MSFYEGDLQSGIALAVQISKAVLCFVTDNSETARAWEDFLKANKQIASKAVVLRLEKDTQEYNFLHSVCPINSTPAIVVITNGTIRANLQSDEVEQDAVESQLKALFGEDMPVEASPANTPAPESALAAIENRTSGSEAGRHTPSPEVQTTAAPRPPPPREPSTPVASSSRHVVPANEGAQAQQTQRQDYVKMQREREQKQREERERIKQQIKADREERRRHDQGRKKNEAQTSASANVNTPAKTSDIRIQVRTFDGSTLRNTFPPSARVAQDVRPWIDEATKQNVPYNLKQILTPLPNRNIEASEEDQSLVDLGIKGSSTLVMVPVHGYVESYAGSTAGGLVGSAISGGYNLVTGTAGALFGGVASLLGYGTTASPPTPAQPVRDSPAPNVPQVRVRTLADQRAEAAKKDQKFYNGNSLNFQSQKEQDEKKDD